MRGKKLKRCFFKRKEQIINKTEIVDSFGNQSPQNKVKQRIKEKIKKSHAENKI